MSFKFDPERVVFEGSHFVIYDIIDQLPTHANYPHGTDVEKPNGERAIPAHWKYGERTKPIKEAFVHQTAGSYGPGFDGVMNTAAFIVRDPTYTLAGKWRGTGRGWPAMCYSYYFPHHPELTPITSDGGGKLIIFKCRPDETKSWHTRGGHNGQAIALGFQGYFQSRHMGRSFVPRRGQTGQPSPAQMDMLRRSWPEYFKPKFGLTDLDVFGHFEARKPKPACPGNELEHWVLATRGLPAEAKKAVEKLEREFVPPKLRTNMVELGTWKRRQAAMVALGYDLGAYGPLKNGVDGNPGDRTRAAIEGLEEGFGLKVNGVWDDRLEFLVQMFLFAQAIDVVALSALGSE